MRIGLREANQKFSSLIRAVRSGKEVILTDRGKPVVRMVPMATDNTEDRVRRMEESGLLIPARKRGPMPPYKGHRIRGTSIVETIREERDED
jgi:prevent-host-death family protein